MPVLELPPPLPSSPSTRRSPLSENKTPHSTSLKSPNGTKKPTREPSTELQRMKSVEGERADEEEEEEEDELDVSMDMANTQSQGLGDSGRAFAKDERVDQDAKPNGNGRKENGVSENEGESSEEESDGDEDGPPLHGTSTKTMNID